MVGIFLCGSLPGVARFLVSYVIGVRIMPPRSGVRDPVGLIS